ncbi:MAG TPA: ferrochelatase [Vicinamibacteria bacterium]|nr:ferrochelatase [Vicinamibacteria bacterium]
MTDVADYDALLVVSFGGPEGPDDVMPFLQNVVRGRNVPQERLRQVAKQYELFRGVSPINAETRRLVEALREELERSGRGLPVYWGNRNWHPFLGDTLGTMADDGIRRALAFVTSAYSSYSSCRQYLEDIERARAAAGSAAPAVDKMGPFFDRPGFIEANRERLQDALVSCPGAYVLFTAHSIPLEMAAVCEYEAQLRETARLVAASLDNPWELVYQSRSGPPNVLWLSPDVLEAIDRLAAEGIRELVLSPIGFVSDHMEVVYDLDIQARRRAASLGVSLLRAGTAGAHPCFVRMIREIVEEHLAGPAPEACPPGCCLPTGQRN